MAGQDGCGSSRAGARPSTRRCSSPLYTQRPIIVAFQHAFHGSTLGAGGIGTRLRGYAGGLLSRDPTFLRTVPGYPLDGSAVVPASNCFRCPLAHPACTSVFPDGRCPTSTPRRS